METRTVEQFGTQIATVSSATYSDHCKLKTVTKFGSQTATMLRATYHDHCKLNTVAKLGSWAPPVYIKGGNVNEAAT